MNKYKFTNNHRYIHFHFILYYYYLQGRFNYYDISLLKFNFSYFQSNFKSNHILFPNYIPSNNKHPQLHIIHLAILLNTKF